MDFKKLKHLLALMDEGNLVELEIIEQGCTIRLKRQEPAAAKEWIPWPPPAASSDGTGVYPAPITTSMTKKEDKNTFEITSPMVGSFYRAPNPAAPPYVEIGDMVTEDQVVCIVEAMKVMNEIKAEVQGEVVDILVENGEPVEYGQSLFIIRLT